MINAISNITSSVIIIMLVCNIILFIASVNIAESLIEIPSNSSHSDLIVATQRVLCATESYVIHIVVSERDKGDNFNQLMGHQDGDCRLKSVILSTVNDHVTIPNQYKSIVTVFIINSKDSIEKFLNCVKRNGGGNNNQKFLVVLSFESNANVAVKIFQRFKSQHFLNVAVISKSTASNVSILIHNPFLDIRSSMIDTMDVSSGYKEDIFFNKWNNSRGHNLVISMYEQYDRAIPKKNGENGYTGVDGFTADLVEERMDASFLYIKPAEMYNGTKDSGVVGDLLRGDADISFNADNLALFIVNGTVEVTESFDRNDICILIPKAGDAPIIYNLLRALSKGTWLLILLSLIVMAVIYHWTQHIQKIIYSTRNRYYEYSWTEISTITFQSFFGDSITRIPTSIPLRLLVIGWCIYSFLITNMYTAKLISSLVKPERLDDIESIEELGLSKLKIIYPTALSTHLKEYLDNRTMSLIKDQLKEVQSWKELDAAIGNKSISGTAYIMMRFYAKLMEKKYYDKSTGRPLYKMMKDCLLSFPRVYFIRLGSMYLDYVNELLRRFHETGFIVKWTKHLEFLNALHGNKQAEDDEDADLDEANIKVVITIEHLQTSFYFLSIGLVAATIVFIAEHVCFWRAEIISNRIEYFDMERARQFGCRVDGNERYFFQQNFISKNYKKEIKTKIFT